MMSCTNFVKWTTKNFVVLGIVISDKKRSIIMLCWLFE